MASPSANVEPHNEKGHSHKFSPLSQSEFHYDHDQDQPLSFSVESTRPSTDDYSDETYNNDKVHVAPQNDKAHAYKFSPLPQSESQHLDHNHDQDQDQPLSVSVESTRPNTDDYYSDEASDNLNAGNAEMIQDLLGLIVMLMLIFSPLYRRMGSPTEDPVPPRYVLNSMYISNFTTANGKLAATWDAKLTIMNTNVTSIYFRIVDFTIFYKQNPEDALSFASSYPFYLDQGEAVKLHLKFTMTKGWEDNQPFVDDWLVEEIGKDRAKDKALSFGMQMKVEAIYYGETWVSDVEMSPHCEDLRVEFVPNMGSGRLTNPNKNFSVPIGWKPFSFF